MGDLPWSHMVAAPWQRQEAGGVREIPGHLESWDSRQGEVEMGWQALQGEPSAPRSPCGSTLASLDRAGRWAAPPSSDPTMAGPGALYSPGKGGLSMAAGPRPVLAPSPWGHPLDARSPAFPPPPFPQGLGAYLCSGEGARRRPIPRGHRAVLPARQEHAWTEQSGQERGVCSCLRPQGRAAAGAC